VTRRANRRADGIDQIVPSVVLCARTGPRVTFTLAGTLGRPASIERLCNLPMDHRGDHADGNGGKPWRTWT
jgi:hypothetical protein